MTSDLPEVTFTSFRGPQALKHRGSKDVRPNHSRPENKGLGAATGPLSDCAAFMRFHGPLRP
jgi:hypothetical protein